MKRRDSYERHREVLECLSSLPRKIMAVHELENVSEFVLHDMCNERCFNMLRAAYFVDNPDFKCLKGVAGFCRDENPRVIDSVWGDPTAFSRLMLESAFNQRVRSVLVDHSAMRDPLPAYITQQLVPMLGFQHPALRMWDLKHYNQGLIVYDQAEADDELLEEYLVNGLHVLGFCAIY